jgi:hypothetical protein
MIECRSNWNWRPRYQNQFQWQMAGHSVGRNLVLQEAVAVVGSFSGDPGPSFAQILLLRCSLHVATQIGLVQLRLGYPLAGSRLNIAQPPDFGLLLQWLRWIELLVLSLGNSRGHSVQQMICHSVLPRIDWTHYCASGSHCSNLSGSAAPMQGLHISSKFRRILLLFVI